MISHVGGPLLVAASELPRDDISSIHILYSFIAGFAHPAVIVFFVLSGYLVGGSLCADVQKGRHTFKEYFIKRVVRLSLVLFPALIVSFVLTRSGEYIFPQVYSTKQTESLDVGAFSCNIIFLQNVFCVRYAGNDSLWSLFNEFWYYILFYLFYVGIFAERATKLRTAMVSAGIVISVLFTIFQKSNAPLLPYFSIWLLGVAVSLVARTPFRAPVRLIAIIWLVYVFCIRVILGADAMHGTTLLSFFTDLISSLLFAWLLIQMRNSDRIIRPPLGILNNKMAEFSFSLYCMHLPVAMFYSALSMRLWGEGNEMVPVSPRHWLILSGCIFSAT